MTYKKKQQDDAATTERFDLINHRYKLFARLLMLIQNIGYTDWIPQRNYSFLQDC